MKFLNLFKKQTAVKSAKIEKVNANQLNKISGGVDHEIKTARDVQSGIACGKR